MKRVYSILNMPNEQEFFPWLGDLPHHISKNFLSWGREPNISPVVYKTHVQKGLPNSGKCEVLPCDLWGIAYSSVERKHQEIS